jgi:hypothetical protein
MIRRTKVCDIRVPLACLCCACGSPKGAAFATLAELPEGPRVPDGVVVEPVAELPVAADTASTDGPLVTLKPPLPDRSALRTLADFYRAAVTENLDAMAELVTADANVPSKTGGSQQLVDFWRARMRQLHYQSVSGELLYRDADVELYRYRDLDAFMPGRPARPTAMTPADVLARVPMRIVQSPSERLFGSDMTFLLRPDRSQFRIRQILEDFQLP